MNYMYTMNLNETILDFYTTAPLRAPPRRCALTVSTSARSVTQLKDTFDPFAFTGLPSDSH